MANIEEELVWTLVAVERFASCGGKQRVQDILVNSGLIQVEGDVISLTDKGRKIVDRFYELRR